MTISNIIDFLNFYGKLMGVYLVSFSRNYKNNMHCHMYQISILKIKNNVHNSLHSFMWTLFKLNRVLVTQMPKGKKRKQIWKYVTLNCQESLHFLGELEVTWCWQKVSLLRHICFNNKTWDFITIKKKYECEKIDM